MSARDKLAAVLGPDFADIIVDSHREAVEDGVRMGLGMAVQLLEITSGRMGNAAQRDALLGCADALRETSAEFTLKDGAA